MEDFLKQRLEARKEKDLYRSLQPTSALLDFSSNDYLGLAKSRKLYELTKETFSEEFSKVKNGAGGSRLLSGNFALFEKCEKTIAQYHNSETALLFNSGYVANIGLLSCIATRHDTILYDELIHASVRDGIRLGHAQSFSFSHNSFQNLKDILERIIAKNLTKNSQVHSKIFIVVESLYSMDGDSPDLGQFLEVCKEYEKIFSCYLIVDEAHAAGVYGESGRGLAYKFAEHPHLLARVITYGKAFGLHGAAVCGSKVLREYLVNFSRPFIYTTAATPEAICAIYSAYLLMPELEEERKKLFTNIRIFSENLLPTSGSPQIETDQPSGVSQIQTIQIPGNENVKGVCASVQEAGFDVRPILSPTVPATKERVRICIHSFNQEKDLLYLATLLRPHAK